MAENAEVPAGHDRQSCDALRHAHGEGIHKGPGVSKPRAQCHNGKAHNGVIAHGYGNPHKNRNKGEHLLKYADGGGRQTDEGNKYGNNHGPGLSLQDLQKPCHQSVERACGDDKTDGGIGDEDEEHHPARVNKAVVDAAEHLKQPHGRALYRVVGIGDHQLPTRVVYCPFKFSSGQNPC